MAYRSAASSTANHDDLSIALQALLIVHCIKTGRNQLWIWVLALLSYAGVIAYVAVEIVPELFRSRAAQRATRNFKKVLNPKADLRRYEREARVTGGVAARQRYADELTEPEREALARAKRGDQDARDAELLRKRESKS